MTNYRAEEVKRVNPYGDRIELTIALKNLDTGETETTMKVGVQRHQVGQNLSQDRLDRYKERMKAKNQ
jgi:hypothetical protein